MNTAQGTGPVYAVRAAPLLLGHRGGPVIDLETLRELLLRVSRVFTMDARIKVAPCPPQDPFLRRLR